MSQQFARFKGKAFRWARSLAGCDAAVRPSGGAFRRQAQESNGMPEEGRLLGDGTPAKNPETTIDHWVVPPDTGPRRKRGRGSGRRTGVMAQPLYEHVEQFCVYQRKQKGKTEGGVRTYRWNLEHFMTFTRNREGRAARVSDLHPDTIQAWMDAMASDDLALSTMRSRQSTLSSLCSWLVKRGILSANPVAKLDRPPHRKETPRQVPGPDLMDQLIR